MKHFVPPLSTLRFIVWHKIASSTPFFLSHAVIRKGCIIYTLLMRDRCVRDIVNKSVIHHASLKIQSSRFQQLTISKIEIVRDVRDFSRKKLFSAKAQPYFLIVNSNFNPPSGKLLTLMVPPCSNTAFLTMARPRPVPPIFRLRPLSTR